MLGENKVANAYRVEGNRLVSKGLVLWRGAGTMLRKGGGQIYVCVYGRVSNERQFILIILSKSR